MGGNTHAIEHEDKDEAQKKMNYTSIGPDS